MSSDPRSPGQVLYETLRAQMHAQYQGEIVLWPPWEGDGASDWPKVTAAYEYAAQAMILYSRHFTREDLARMLAFGEFKPLPVLPHSKRLIEN